MARTERYKWANPWAKDGVPPAAYTPLTAEVDDYAFVACEPYQPCGDLIWAKSATHALYLAERAIGRAEAKLVEKERARLERERRDAEFYAVEALGVWIRRHARRLARRKRFAAEGIGEWIRYHGLVAEIRREIDDEG